MANIPKVDGNFELEVNNATQSYEDTLYTDNKNISGNIHIHITAKSGVLNNTPTSGITYTEDTSQQSVLPSEGALYLNEGYYQNTKITLDHMLPDPSGTYTNPGTNDIRAGRKAYDGRGKLIVGTMADITPGFSGGTPSLTNTTNTITTNMATASSGTYKINAVAKAKATRTKVSYNNDYTGYLDKASGTEASAATTSAEGSINATTIYIKSCTITNNTSGGSSSGTINRGSQIKIGQGYNPNDIYYTAQANSGTKTITANGVESCDGYASVDVQVPTGITPTGTITLTQQTGTDVTNYKYANVQGGSAVASATKGTVSGNKVTVTPKVTKTAGWISTETVSGTAVEVSASELVSGTLTPTSSGVKDVTNYASVNITAGTAGTPTATKGTVSGNKVTVTPKVTNSAGWISSGTITGTAITVTASELVSGTYTVTGSGNANVTNYASISVASGSASQPTTTVTAGTISLSGVTITLQANVTPSVSPGWVASGTAGVVKIKGEVPVESKSCTPSTETQTITPTSGKLLSSVIVNAIPKKAYTFVSNDYTTSSNYFYCSGEFELRVYNGTNWASSGVYKNKAFRVKSISTSNKTTILTYEICETIESTSMFDATQHTLSVTGTSSTGTAKFVTSDGAAQRFSSSSYSETSNIDNSSSYTGTTPHSFHLIKMYAYISAFGSSKSKTIYIRANYVRSFSGSNSSGSVYNNANARASLEYSTDGSTWTQASCYVSVSGSGSGTASGSHHIKNIYWSYMENVMFNELI